MLERWSIVTALSTTGEPRELKRIYGEAVISQVGSYNLIHLDSPSVEEVQHRLSCFDPVELDQLNPVCLSIPLDVIYLGQKSRLTD